MRWLAAEVLYIGLIAGYSLYITHHIPRKFYSLSNLVVSLACIAYGLFVGLNFSDMGLAIHHVMQGIIVGLVVSLPIILIILLGARVRWLQPVIGTAKKQSSRQIAYELGFRLPFGTALSEEVIFRGVLLGLLLQHHSQPVAVLVASLLFGLWHIIPTIETIRTHSVLSAALTKHTHRHILSVVGTVCLTTIAGVAFSCLRFVSGSIVAPWLLHCAINGSGLASSYVQSLLRTKKTV